jgi:hypothetical protein
MPTLRKTVEHVVQVRCLQCRHKSFLTDRDLIEFGIAENAPIVAFVKPSMHEMWQWQCHGK